MVGESTCCSQSDVEDARQVAFGLGLEHFTFNFTGTFGCEVIDRFCDAYLHGRTPNPCIDCNRYLKFAALQRRRAQLGFNYVATGHYARRAFNERTGRFELRRGLDEAKDQSYVLYHLTQDDLAHMLFPLGELTKPQVRELAEKHSFGNAHKAESQDICFVPDGDYASFIARYMGFGGDAARGDGKERRSLRRSNLGISSTLAARCLGGTPDWSTTRLGSGRASALLRPSRCTWWAKMPARTCWW